MPQPFKQRARLALPVLDERFPDHEWVFWATPTVPVLHALTRPFAMREGDHTEDEEQAALDGYMAAVAELVLDTGASAIDLSTPEAVNAALNDPNLDTELISGIIGAYVVRVFKLREAAKKKVTAA